MPQKQLNWTPPTPNDDYPIDGQDLVVLINGVEDSNISTSLSATHSQTVISLPGGVEVTLKLYPVSNAERLTPLIAVFHTPASPMPAATGLTISDV